MEIEKHRKVPGTERALLFVALEDQEAISLSEVDHLSYASCLNCHRHPKYPNIPPMTLHLNGICQICGESPDSRISLFEDLK